MALMKAYLAPEPGGPEKLHLTEVEIPKPNPGEVLIKIAAIGLNRADILQREGKYPPPPGTTDVIGLEVSGTVVDSRSAHFSIGDEVCALLPGGGYAQFVTAPECTVLPIPHTISLIDSAAIPEAACTTWANVFFHDGLRSQELLLVHGGAGGIGSQAIQIAKYMGARVAATAGSDDKTQLCQQLGADTVINYRTENFAEILRGHVDVILDVIGAKYVDQNIEALARYGRLRIIGLQGGVMSELNLGKLIAKNAAIQATTLRARELEGRFGKAAIVKDVHKYLWPGYSDGRIRPYISAYFPFSAAIQAHEYFESSAATGKTVLTI